MGSDAPDEAPLLEASGVTVRVGGKTLLRGVAIDVMPASIHAIVGPNGAGKSTLLAALLGQVAFTGSVVTRFRKQGRVGYVPQAFSVDATLPITTAEFLALTRQRWPVCFGIRPKTRSRIDALLDEHGITPLAGQRLGALSGGELRRVLLANAMDPAPELLVLDEPENGLDPESRSRLQEALSRLRAREGTAVLFVSHDIEEARRIADRATRLHPEAWGGGSRGEAGGSSNGEGSRTGPAREILGEGAS